MVPTPLRRTNVRVDAAAGLLDQGRYREANLAPKAAQDLSRTDTVGLGQTAAQAAEMTGTPGGPAAASAPAPAKT